MVLGPLVLVFISPTVGDTSSDADPGVLVFLVLVFVWSLVVRVMSPDADPRVLVFLVLVLFLRVFVLRVLFVSSSSSVM